MIRTTLYLLQ